MRIIYPVLDADLATFKMAVSQTPTTIIDYVSEVDKDNPEDNPVRKVYLQFSDPRDLVQIGMAFVSMALSFLQVDDDPTPNLDAYIGKHGPANNNRVPDPSEFEKPTERASYSITTGKFV